MSEPKHISEIIKEIKTGWRTTVGEVKIGDPVENNRNGKGIVSDKTARTITVTFENGNKVKNTYHSSKDYFWQTDF